ncbi:MAG: AAA family ATPase [Chloroflexota bacterium]
MFVTFVGHHGGQRWVVARPDIGDVLPMIVAITLSLMALVVLLILLRRSLLSGSDRQRAALDKNWTAWEPQLHSVFLFYGRIEEEMLPAVPLRYRAAAMQRYVQSRPDDALAYYPDPPRVELTAPKNYKAFLRNWKAAWEMVEDEATFRSISSLIARQLCDVLGFTMVDSRNYRDLVGYVIKASTLRLNLPPRFPIIFVRRREFGPDDIDDLGNFMGILNMTSFFALLIDLNDNPDKLEKRKNLRLLVRESIHDFIALDGTALRHILMAREPDRRLIDIILGQVDLTVVSPYVTSGPVPENMFFGREYEIKTIARKIKDASFALVGGRKIGKTSTLSKVYRTLAETMDHFPLYLDCQSVRDYRTFFEAMSAIWEVRLPEPSPENFRHMVVELAREWKRGTIVVLLDEVDALLQHDLQNQETLFRVFRALSQEAKCRFVFCGERVLDARLHAPDSPLFNFCDVIRLSYLDRKSARRIIEDPMGDMGIQFEDLDATLMRIMDLSSCHPNIVQYICQQLIQAINARGSRLIQLADLDAVARSGVFREFFIEVTWGNATPLQKMLSLLLIDLQPAALSRLNEELARLDVQVTQRQLEEAIQGLYLYSIAYKDTQGYVLDNQMFPDIARKHLALSTMLAGLAEEWQQTHPAG